MSQLVIEMGTLVTLQKRLLTGQFCSGLINPNQEVLVWRQDPLGEKKLLKLNFVSIVSSSNSFEFDRITTDKDAR